MLMINTETSGQISKLNVVIGLICIIMALPIYPSVCLVHSSDPMKPQLEITIHSTMFQSILECEIHKCVTSTGSSFAYLLSTIMSIMLLVAGIIMVTGEIIIYRKTRL